MISSSEEIFNEAATCYNDALKSSGYKEKIKYTPISDPEQKRRIRKRKILWVNPPYSMNVKTNIVRNFLQLLDKHFPPGHKLHKIFNRNNVKVSYEYTPRAASIIKNHNKKILENQPSNTTAECNCRVDFCPLQGKCQTENVVYLAQVTNRKNSERKCYIGLTERTLKDRLYKHRNSLRHRSKAYSTVLSRFNDITRLYLLNTQSQITTPVKKIGVKCEFYKNISKYFGFKHLVVILYILIHVKAYNVTILFFMISMVVLT